MAFHSEGERPAESPLIETLWRSQSESAGSFISTASTQGGIVLARYEERTTLTIRGPETQATHAAYPAGVEFFGINFKLGTFMPTFPVMQIMDRQDLILPDVGHGLFWLQGALWELPTFENVDSFIARLVRQGLLTRDPLIETVMQGRMGELSRRSIQRRFLHATGLTLKSIQQIERAHRAAALLEQGRSILDTTYDLGYFDQSHLTNSLKHFIGRTPAQIHHPAE